MKQTQKRKGYKKYHKSNVSIFRVIEFIILTCILITCLVYIGLILKYNMRKDVDRIPVTATVIDKSYEENPVTKWNSATNQYDITSYEKIYNVTVNYHNVDVVIDNKDLYTQYDIGKKVHLILRTAYDKGQVIDQELIYP